MQTIFLIKTFTGCFVIALEFPGREEWCGIDERIKHHKVMIKNKYGPEKWRESPPVV